MRSSRPVSRSAPTACGSPSDAHDHHARRLAARHPPASSDSRRSSVRSARGSWRRRSGRFTARTTSQHPFHQLMYEGKLTQRQFQGWVANRLAYQRVVPRKDAAILSNCPDADVRREWIQRIVDHDGTAPGHGRHRDVDPAGRRARACPARRWRTSATCCPAVRLICESYVTFCRSKPWQEACASSLTELFAPKIHQQRIEAFPRHYPWIPPEALDYFKSRLVQAPRDVGHGLRIVQAQWATTHRTPAQGLRGARVQARDAVGDDRHDPQRLPRGLT